MLAKKNARVLIVEDDEDDYIIARDSLEELDDYNFEIEWVTSPEQALAKLKENAHDICLLDYLLGAHTGLKVLIEASELQCRVPIIMLTGQSDNVLDKAALDAGAVDFVLKSEFDSPRFSRAVLYALARHEVEQERLERINLQTKSKAKDRFLAHLSHELRTPLTSILGYTELLLEKQELSEGHQELNIILNNSNHLLSLLNDVLDLSKIAADKLELTTKTFYLDSFLADIYTLMAISALDKGITLTFNADSPLPEKVTTDATRLRQVLINLVHNAIKFTDQGGVQVSVSSRLTESGLCNLEIGVRDTGSGIPQDKLEAIFQPFEQVADTVLRREAGAGLGLAISSKLANMLGGKISATSEVGKGSQFRLEIAAEVPSSVAMIAPEFKQASYSSSTSSIVKLAGRVLIVDDLFDIRKLVGHLVKGFGLQVEFASNGQEAFDLVESNIKLGTPFDAVIMDIHMPIMDGKEAVVKIRQLGFEQTVIALTAATMKGVENQLIQLGFNFVLSKPVDKSMLNKLLAKSLNRQCEFEPPQAVLADNEKSSGQSKALQKVLLVEDDQDAAGLTQLLLESLGAQVTVVHSGEACLALLNQNLYWDKALLDLNLPDSHGFELAAVLRASNQAKQIVIVSGEPVDQQALEQNGCVKALLKPLNKKALKTVLDC